MAVGSEALLAQRGRFHALYRLGVRSYDVFTGVRSDGRSSRKARRAIAHTPLDLAVGAVLHQSRRFGLLPRLLLDACDTATASVVEGHSYTGAARVSLPLSIEAGIRMGLAGLAVPAGHLVAVAFLRRRRGLPIRPATLGWQVLGVGAGMAIGAYERTTRAADLARHRQVVGAQVQRARLAGQNAMAMGADSAIDLLIRTSLLVEAQARTTTGTQAMLSSWKAMVASNTTGQATYLGTALHRWQQRHNDQPALAKDVELRLGQGEGTVLLSPSQLESLERSLDAMELRGPVEVKVLDPVQARLPGAPRRLMVASEQAVVPADPEATVVPLDLGPAALGLAAVLSALPVLPSQGGARWSRVAAAVGFFVGAAAWAQQEVARHGPRAHPRIFLVGQTACLVQAATTLPALGNRVDASGLHPQVHLYPLYAQAALAALYQKDLAGTVRAAGALASLASIGVGTAVLRPSRTEVLLALSWGGLILPSLLGLARALEEAEAAFVQGLRLSEEATVSEAFRAGRDEVLELIRSTHHELTQVLAADDGRLGPPDRAEIDCRLEEVSRRLALAERLPAPAAS